MSLRPRAWLVPFSTRRRSPDLAGPRERRVRIRSSSPSRSSFARVPVRAVEAVPLRELPSLLLASGFGRSLPHRSSVLSAARPRAVIA
jgi:hypothetical protein